MAVTAPLELDEELLLDELLLEELLEDELLLEELLDEELLEEELLEDELAVSPLGDVPPPQATSGITMNAVNGAKNDFILRSILRILFFAFKYTTKLNRTEWATEHICDKYYYKCGM